MSLFRQLLIANSQEKKRPYYCEVEYLESTGKQYIDTGLCGTLSSTVDVVFGLSTIEQAGSNNGAIFGGRTSQTSNTFTLFYLASTAPQYFRFDYNGQTQVGTSNTMTFDITSKYNFTYDGSTYKITNLTTNENLSANKIPPTSINTSNISLFAVNTNGVIGTYFKGRIYSYKYSDGETSIDLIPVLDWYMKPCMYDEVSGQLFYNAGTDEFLYGREIHEVEYLESTGTQYIDTGYSLNTNTDELSIDYTNTSEQNYKWMFGEYESGKLFGITSQNVEEPRFAYRGLITATKEEQYYTKHTLIANSDGLFNDGIQKSSFVSFEGSWNIYLFALNNTGTSVNGYFGYGKIYSYMHKRNGSLIRDFVPAVDENGVGFMFDRVTHIIFDNAGTDVFSYPPVELEYLESSGGSHIDIGIKPTDEYGYHIRNTYRYGGGEQCAIGCMDAGNRFVGVYTGGSQISGGWGSFVNYLKGSYKFEDDTIWDVYCNYKNDRQIIVNNELLKDLTDIHIEGTINNTLYLFARHYGNNITRMYGRIYSTEITKGSDVVAHFIPAFKDGQVGMWDKVNNTLYTNAGTGSFVIGKIVEKQI